MAVLLALVSCREPLSRESFVRASARDTLGRYAFSLPLVDSSRTYDLSFYTRSTLSDRHFKNLPDTCYYDLVLESPSGSAFGETLCFLRDSYSASSFFSKAYNIPFREGFRPVEYGDWLLYIKVYDEETLGLDGFGLKLSKN